MSWQGQMTTVVRHLINDVDPSNYTFSTDRVETTILVAAQLLIMNVDFNNTYDVNVEASTLSPDPSDLDTKDDPFIALACLRAACIIVGSEIRKESGNQHQRWTFRNRFKGRNLNTYRSISRPVQEIR